MTAKGFKLLDAYVAVHGDGSGVIPDTVKDMQSDDGKVVSAGSSFGSSLVKGITGALTAGIKVVATGLVGITTAATIFGVAAFKDAARVQELDIAMQAVAKSAGYAYTDLSNTANAVKANGIEMATAQTLAIQFAQSHLNLADAVKVSRVAQDLAVITGQNSTDVTNQLLDAITSQNTQILRSAGITTSAAQMYDVYAASIGVTAKDLTDMQKKQALVNGIIADGTKVAGTYEASLGSASKVLRSLPRIFNDIGVTIGGIFLNAIGDSIVKFYGLAKAFDLAIQKGGPLYPIIQLIGEKLKGALSPIGTWIDKATVWVSSLKVSQDQLDKLGKWLDDLIANGPAILAVFAGLLDLGGQNIPIIGGLLANVNPLVAALITLGLTDPTIRIDIKELLGSVSDAMGSLKPLLKALADLVHDAIPAAEAAISGLAGGLADKAKPKVTSDPLSWLKSLANNVGVIAGGIVGEVQIILDALSGKDVSGKASTGGYGFIWQQIEGSLLDFQFIFLPETIGMFQDFVANTVGMFSDWGTNTFGMFQDWGSNTAGMFTDWDTNTKGMFHDFFTNTVGMFSDFFTVKIPGVANGFFGWWNGFWGKVGSSIGDAIQGGITGVKGAINGIIDLINGAIGGINTLIRGVNNLPGINLAPIGKIPHLASGGTLTRGGLTLVGERGKELLDLPAGSQVTNATDTSRLLSGQAGSGGDTYITIENLTLPVDSLKDVQTAIDTLKALRQRARKGVSSGASA